MHLTREVPVLFPRSCLALLAGLLLEGHAGAQPAPTPAPGAAPADLTLLRVDLEDGFALHPWLYHELRLSQRWGILFDVHAQTPGTNPRFPPFLELEVGPVLHLGPLQINPQIGVDLAWREGAPGSDDPGHTRAADFIVQLYLILAWNRLAAESWNLYFIPFDGSHSFYMMRQLAAVRLVGGLSLGPHLEGTWTGRHRDRLAIGGDLVHAFRWGQLGLFLAYEETRGVAETRVTFIREL